ncbi:MAG: FAD-dependent oxidoreductase [Planctomycetota bacterium]|nr:FAD-dependent oxidoreductase [Planctomycetota bacterium]
MRQNYRVIVIGGGHAGAEAAWAAANLLPPQTRRGSAEPRATVALVTLDPAKIGVMPCNPAIGGLAKGQLVREIDALGGLMGLAADASGIQFKVLNASRGAAVRGPRCQNDKHAYAEAVQSLIRSRPEIDIIAASVEDIIVERGCATGVVIKAAASDDATPLHAPAVVLTTGTFMRGLMHTGRTKTPGGRHGEGAATGMSACLQRLGFELGRLKTGTPPRLDRTTIDWDSLPVALGDETPTPLSELSAVEEGPALTLEALLESTGGVVGERFPKMQQIECRQTNTTPEMHEVIRANLHRAPIYTGDIKSAGPRYCPSIEDKVVRFADRPTHGVFLEPESLRSNWVYCNGIATSLPADVQELLVRAMPGCERAEIHRYGYAVEYDMVRPHQINATCMTKPVGGLFLAGQINGTSGYEEAAAQGVVAGINAARLARSEREWTLGRDQAYIGVLMDDLVTKTPVEPYRMFTSRAEHRLLLRADNAADRLTPLARELGALDSTDLGRWRTQLFGDRERALTAARTTIARAQHDGVSLAHAVRQDRLSIDQLRQALDDAGTPCPLPVAATLHAEARYEGYIRRQCADIKRRASEERRTLPAWIDYRTLGSLRTEAREALARFRPTTFGQASRLEGLTPADVTLLTVLVDRARKNHASA